MRHTSCSALLAVAGVVAFVPSASGPGRDGVPEPAPWPAAPPLSDGNVPASHIRGAWSVGAGAWPVARSASKPLLAQEPWD